MKEAQASRHHRLHSRGDSRLGRKLHLVYDCCPYYHRNTISFPSAIFQECSGESVGEMADPRQMWENLQKGLARAQQSGQRCVYAKSGSSGTSRLNGRQVWRRWRRCSTPSRSGRRLGRITRTRRRRLALQQRSLQRYVPPHQSFPSI